MTAVAPRPVVERAYPVTRSRPGVALLGYLRTTDPKTLGKMYICTAFFFFMVGGLMALLMRAELARPGLQFLSQEQYNQLLTMHGTIMLLFYATAIVFGFANFVLPLQIGAPDVAFPRLNSFSYWLYLFGALHRHVGLRDAQRGGRVRVDRLHAAVRLGELAGRRWRPVDHGPGRLGSGHHPRRRQHDHHRDLPPGSRHDDVAAADLHLEHPGHVDPGPDRVPDPHRGVVRFGRRPASRAPTSSTRPTAGRSCGSTCSGSSGIPRSTSSLCRSSASSPRFSRCSPGNPASVTGVWSMPRCPSRRCPWRCGRITCSPPAPCCCPSSAS